MQPRILVIKLGALGDFVQALGAMNAIRTTHADAHLTLLTTAPFRPLAAASPWFDEIWIDDRPSGWRFGAWLDLRRRLVGAGFTRVYDLQTSDRSGWYYRLMLGAQPEWSGIAAGCSHPHANPGRDEMHTIDRISEQMAAAGIATVPPPKLDWFDAPVAHFGLPRRFALLVPGGAAHRPAKRWPAPRYAELAVRLVDMGVRPVMLGGDGDEAAATAIAAECPDAANLLGQTSLLEVAGLARHAVGAVGNDTGPMHIAAAVGCPAVALFSNASDPALCGQRGPAVTILRRPDLADLSVSEVEAALRLR